MPCWSWLIRGRNSSSTCPPTLEALANLERHRVPFATVRLRQRVTKGAGARTKGLLMAYKLLEMGSLAAARRHALAPARPSGRRVRGWGAASE